MKIAYISTYLPRECGIATFNSNLILAISSNFKDQVFSDSGFVVALNDSDDIKQYIYPKEVKFVIRQEQQKDYIHAAEFINNSDADSCILEHEFGIYGGECGIYLLSLLTSLQKPLITILHTVLREPNYTQKLITRQIAQHSSRIVVMSKKAVMFLTTIYGIPLEKIQLIEHGVPDLESPKINLVKNLAPFKGKKTLFTFGLISRNKGLETVIRALPGIVKKHPDAVYVILGNTHPGVIKNSGEEYRDSLKQLAEELQVADHLFFINKFVSEEELMHYLTACDIYVTPYLNEAQITSGTLSYAVGAGAAVVSTPYWHAQELLDNNRGRLFNFKDFNTLADIVNDLLDNEDKLTKLKKNAYEYGLHLRWPFIGKQYINAFNKAIKDARSKTENSTSLPEKESLPPFDLTHIRRLTDSTGLIQHAKYGIPNYKEGYCLDDNSRALILMLMVHQYDKSAEALELFPKYLSYIHYMQREDGNFRNFLSFNRDYLDEKGSEDSFGRTIWALGYLINASPNNSYREFGEDLLRYSIPHFKNLRYIRGIANTLIGVTYYLKTYPSDGKMMAQLQILTEQLVATYKANRSENWHWFESSMTYDNAILPLALLHSSEITGIESVRLIALESLTFLEEKTFYKEYLTPVGNTGWLIKGGEAPLYDQQAIETMAMVLMYSQAYHLTQDPKMLHKMYQSFMWFYGLNELRIPLYDSETKGCSDGLQMSGINRNQGAESTLACLISHIAVLKGMDDASRYYKIKRKASASVL
ncbi:glycosyltransferase family 4 protein [Arcticibacter eurypsychrophilus]|uniref:glycosyltransferase family 4 protein n=1 Tax=Arcticibacter eurypsychrophilus TaxID=1434752 RepID=UPI00084CF176|nr:glycosyltransferase family 4 protein [Arcticibacter eurypsychrophilus]